MGDPPDQAGPAVDRRSADRSPPHAFPERSDQSRSSRDHRASSATRRGFLSGLTLAAVSTLSGCGSRAPSSKSTITPAPVPDASTPNTPTVSDIDEHARWRHPNPFGVSSIAAAPRQLFFVGGEASVWGRATAADPASGETQWSVRTEFDAHDAIILPDRLVVRTASSLTDLSQLFGIDRGNGDLVWNRGFGTAFLRVVVAGGLLYVAEASAIHVFDPASGDRVRSHEPAFDVGHLAANRGTIYVAGEAPSGRPVVQAIDVERESTSWRVPAGASVYDIAAADSGIYVGTRAGVRAFDPENGITRWRRTLPGGAWSVSPSQRSLLFAGPETGAIDASTGSLLWRTERGPSANAVVPGDGVAYAVRDQFVTVHDSATGDPVWRLRSASNINGVLEHGELVYLADTGGVSALDLP